MKRSWLIAGGVCGVVGSACCSLGAVALWFGADAAEKVAPAAVACDGQPVPGASAPSPGQSSATLGFEPSLGTWGQYFGLPSDWEKAETAAEARWVVCLEENVAEVEIEACAYGEGADEYVIRRTQKIRRGRVVDASTGQTMHTAFVPGPVPDECPDELTTYELSGVNVSRRERVEAGGNPAADGLELAFGDVVRGGKASPIPGVEPPWTDAQLPQLEGLLVAQDASSLSVAFVESSLEEARERIHGAFRAGGWAVTDHTETEMADALDGLRDSGMAELADELAKHASDLASSEVGLGDTRIALVLQQLPDGTVRAHLDSL